MIVLLLLFLNGSRFLAAKINTYFSVQNIVYNKKVRLLLVKRIKFANKSQSLFLEFANSLESRQSHEIIVVAFQFKNMHIELKLQITHI